MFNYKSLTFCITCISKCNIICCTNWIKFSWTFASYTTWTTYMFKMFFIKSSCTNNSRTWFTTSWFSEFFTFFSNKLISSCTFSCNFFTWIFLFNISWWAIDNKSFTSKLNFCKSFWTVYNFNTFMFSVSMITFWANYWFNYANTFSID